MAGTKIGGINARETNKQRYGDDFYVKLGMVGGRAKSPRKGFGGNRELAREAGRKGGTISKRRKVV